MFWSIAYQSRCDALLRACLRYCIPQYAWDLWYPSSSTYSGKRDHIEGPNSHNCTQNNENASDASFDVDSLRLVERGKDNKSVCLKEREKKKEIIKKKLNRMWPRDSSRIRMWLWDWTASERTPDNVDLSQRFGFGRTPEISQIHLKGHVWCLGDQYISMSHVGKHRSQNDRKRDHRPRPFHQLDKFKKNKCVSEKIRLEKEHANAVFILNSPMIGMPRGISSPTSLKPQGPQRTARTRPGST